MSYILGNFHKWTPVICRYSNNRTAIEYWSESEYGPECECTASVNLPDEDLEDDEIAVKSYSENEGMLEAMIAAGHVSEPIKWVDTRFVRIAICKLLIKDQTK